MLGSAGLFGTVAATSTVLRREAPLSVAAVILFALLVRDGLGRGDGLLLGVVLVACLGMLVWGALGRPRDALAGDVAEFVDGDPRHRWGVEVTRTVVGLAGTLAGAQLLVWGAAGVAQRAGLSQALVGRDGGGGRHLRAGAGDRHPGRPPRRGGAAGRQPARQQPVQQPGGRRGGRPGGRAAAATDTTLAGVALLMMVAVSLAAWGFLFRTRRLLRWEAAALLAAWPVALALLGR